MMSVSESILTEADFFAVSLLSGCIIILVYDVLRVLRRLIPHGTLWVAIEDVIYWLSCALFIFAMLYQKNDGLIRGFAICGILVGMIFYNHFISPRVIKWIVFLLQKIIKIVTFPIRFLAKQIKKPLGFLHKKSRRLLKKMKKLLKKTYKAVKMGLSKH